MKVLTQGAKFAVLDRGDDLEPFTLVQQTAGIASVYTNSMEMARQYLATCEMGAEKQYAWRYLKDVMGYRYHVIYKSNLHYFKTEPEENEFGLVSP